MYLQYLDAQIQCGTLHLHLPDGTVRRCGQGDPQADWFLHRPSTLGRILRNPARMLGETYLRGEWDTNVGQLPVLLALLMRNIPHSPQRPLMEFWQRLYLRLPDMGLGARLPVDHAELDEWVLGQFLDADLHYASGYYTDPDISLEEAQRAKCRHLMRKLCLQAGQHVLDLNADWGALALFLAEHGDVRVTAVTRSRKQQRYGQQQAHRRGLKHQVSFVHQEYRQAHGTYDRVVAAGLVERLAPTQYADLFRYLGARLTDDGIAVVQSLGRLGTPGRVNPWLQRHVFPFQYNPSLSQLGRGVESSGLQACDVEVQRQHFVRTLAAWQLRFLRNRPAIAHRMGERFCRLWEFYLAACEAGFRWRDLALFELQLARHKHRLPATRDYLYPAAEVPPADTAIPLAELTGRARAEGGRRE